MSLPYGANRSLRISKRYNEHVPSEDLSHLGAKQKNIV